MKTGGAAILDTIATRRTDGAPCKSVHIFLRRRDVDPIL